VIPGVLGHAPDGVAAHLGLGSVGVEHAHPQIGYGARQDQHEPVAADAHVTVAHAAGQAGRVGDRFLESVDVDVIVAGAVHLGEAHDWTPATGPNDWSAL